MSCIRILHGPLPLCSTGFWETADYKNVAAPVKRIGSDIFYHNGLSTQISCTKCTFRMHVAYLTWLALTYETFKVKCKCSKAIM